MRGARRPIVVGATCLTAPGPRCGIDVRVYGGKRVARRVVTVRVGRSRLLRVAVPRRVAAWVRSGSLRLISFVRVAHPDGRNRVAFVHL